MWLKAKSKNKIGYLPAGTFIRTEKGYFYIFSDTKRMRFINKRVLHSWNPQRIVDTTEANVARYRITSKMKFRSGTLLHNQADGKMYLVSGNKIRHITSPDILDRLGVKYKDFILVSSEEVNLHEKGEDLN